MAREDLHFRLRIPEDLKSRVEKAASENHRSMTAEIVARLEATFTTRSKLLQKNILEGESLEDLLVRVSRVASETAIKDLFDQGYISTPRPTKPENPQSTPTSFSTRRSDPKK